MVGEEAQNQLHVLFFPFMAHGHMIPLFDIARLFAARGAKATIITTPANAPVFAKALHQTTSLHCRHDHAEKYQAVNNVTLEVNNNGNALNIELEIIRFRSEEVGLPAGLENFEHVTGNDVLAKFLDAVERLRGPVEQALGRLRPRPSCLVSDLFLPWTADVAAAFGIPRLVFHGSGFFAMSVVHALQRRRTQLAAESSEDEELAVPGLPGEVRMTARMLRSEEKSSAMMKLERAFEAEERSYGVVMNSFYELEPDYAEHYRRVMGRRAWSVGPVSLFNRDFEDKATRGKKPAIDEHQCLQWLDSEPPNSVIYICFGSVVSMSSSQLREIAIALEASDQYFIWVVRNPNPNNEDDQWLPAGFESRTHGKGLIIRGWAPQVMILDHGAVGGFVTHCGWNSTLEGISAGVPMVTWPVFAEQFINEKLITEVLRIGVSVGAEKYWDRVVAEVSVGREAVEVAVRRVMTGEEAGEMRRRVGELKEMAWKAVEEGGSSYRGLSDLLKELSSFRGCDEY